MFALIFTNGMKSVGTFCMCAPNTEMRHTALGEMFCTTRLQKLPLQLPLYSSIAGSLRISLHDSDS